MGDDEEPAAAELLGKCFERCQSPVRCLVLALGAAETTGNAQGIQLRARLHALSRTEAALGQFGNAPDIAQPQACGDQICGFGGPAQGRGHHRVPLITGQNGNGVAGLGPANVVQGDVS
jgi:hypothetical protein